MSSQAANLIGARAGNTAAYDPFIRGRFPVGVRTFQAADPARGRLFPCEVWYPATSGHAGRDLARETQDAVALRSGGTRPQMAVRDAAAEAGVYPLVIFSHHSGGDRRASTFVCTHLASHGYVVAALDHSEVIVPELSRPAVETEEQRQMRWQAVIDSRVPDARFLIDVMLDPGSWKSEAGIDPGRIGIMGHSFGGWTALATPEVDQRIRAVVAMAPGGASQPRPGILPVKLTFLWGRDVPTMYLVAENDVALPLAGMYELFDRTPPGKQMVILRRADHMHFIDDVEQNHEAFRLMAMPPEVAQMQKEMLPVSDLSSGEQAHAWVRGLTLAHMEAILKAKPEAEEFLHGDLEGELAKRGVKVILRKPIHPSAK
jgi:dienelactone hydrolase